MSLTHLLVIILLPFHAFKVQSAVNQNDPVIQAYIYPRIIEKAGQFSLKANNTPVDVIQTSAGPFASFSCKGELNIQISMPLPSHGEISISPKRYGIKPERDGNIIRFTIPGPLSLAIMINEYPVMYVFANPLPSDIPDRNDPKVRFFGAGQVYETGQLILKDGETVYIEGGAVVRGSIFASSASNIRIGGYGVLDGGYYEGLPNQRSILFENCHNSVIENITMIEPSSWMIVLGLCEHITVKNVKQLGFVSSSDGVDIVGSKHIKILDSFLRNGDDCIVIKSFDLGRYNKNVSSIMSRDVEDVEINGCAVISFRGGQAFEIGHELTTESVKNIRFINCDVLGVHDQGGVFGMHNSDRAVISDILYENIRVEHYYNKLVDLRIIKSRYFRDEERGQIRNVVFRNIDVTVSKYNPGYSISLIGGYDENHTIENVLFENFMMGGVKVNHPDQMDLYIKQTKGVKFK